MAFFYDIYYENTTITPANEKNNITITHTKDKNNIPAKDKNATKRKHIHTMKNNKKTRTQSIRKVNNRLHIYYNSEDKIFYNTPQENKRQLLKKQNMFGYVTDQKFNQPLQKGTTQYESVEIVQAEGETNAVYVDDGRQTWISPLKYPAFERQIIAETARRLKIDHRTDAHKAAKEKIKAICKDQAIQHAKMITVFKASEFISILKNHETFDTSKKVLVASKRHQ